MTSRFFIITYGCQMNDYDSELLAARLEEAGWQPATEQDQADLILINTCCVRQHPEERALGRLTFLKPWKTRRAGRLLALIGCLAQREGEQLLKRFPFLDLVVGTRDFLGLPELIERCRRSGQAQLAVESLGQPMEHLPAPQWQPGVRARITITYGCDNFCAYCVVPYVRGREVYRPYQEIVKEATLAASRGYPEIQLLGQNVNSYRDAEVDFAELLHLLNKLPGLSRIRFVTSHPKDLSERLIDAIQVLDKVCEHIHLPLQAGSNKILELMNRGYTRENYLRLVEKLRHAVPQIAISTDLMVGFPGEQEEDFQQTLEMVELVGWDSAFTFMYVPRPGTAAAHRFQDDVSMEVKKRRLSELIELTEQSSLRRNQQLIGQTVEILVESRGRRPGQWRGRTRTDKLVVVSSPENLMGRFLEVKVTHAYAHTLLAEHEAA